MRRLRCLGLCAVLLVVAAVAFGVRWGDASLLPPRPGAGVTILLVSNGYHSGLVLPRPELAEVAGRSGAGAALAVTTRFQHYAEIELGWARRASTATCRRSMP